MERLKYFRDNASEGDMQAAILARTKSLRTFERLGNKDKVFELRYHIQHMEIDRYIIIDRRKYN